MNIFKFEFKRGFKSSVIWSVVSGALIILFMSLFPSMKESSMMDIVTTKMDSLPEGMLKAFNISGMMDFSNLFDYLAYSLQYIALAAAIYGLILGVNSLIKEETDGTIEFLYSKPVSRENIFLSKLFANLTLLLFYLVIMFIVIIISALIVKDNNILTSEVIEKSFQLILSITAVSVIFLFMGITLSTVMKSSKNSTSLALGLFFTTYFVGIVSKLKEEVELLKYLSPVDYFVPSEIIKNGFEGKFILIGGIIILLSGALGFLVYKKKDL